MINLIPELRFPEFTDEWRVERLGNIAKFSKGANISKDDIVESGETKAILYGELYTTYSETIRNVASSVNLPLNRLITSQKNDVIIPASGETHIDIATAACVPENDIALGGDINIIRSKNDGVFLAYYFNNKKKVDIARLAQGVSVVHLYSSNLKDLSLNIPSLSEQEKIAAFMEGGVDRMITVLTGKVAAMHEYKKGVMQALFSGKLRFKDENGNPYPDWQKVSIGSSVSFLKDGTHGTHEDTPGGGYTLLSAKNIKGGRVILDSSERQISEEEFRAINKNYKLQRGDILLTIVGTIGNVAMWDKELENVAFQRSVAFLRFREMVPRFAFYLLNSFDFQRELRSRTVISAQPGVYLGDIAKITISIPRTDEQQKIANFLTAIDDKIKLEEAKLAKSKEFKKSLLQRMFV